MISARPTGRIIDLGHGDGHFATIIRPHGIAIHVGIDRSHDELLRAKKKKSARHLVVADMARAPFRPGVFDAAMTNCVLEHVEDVAAVYQETARVLRPSGIFLASVVTAAYEDRLLWPRVLPSALGRRYLKYIRDRFVHRRYWTPAEWKSAAAPAFGVERTISYGGARRIGVMDLFLPGVVYARMLRAIFGREVLSPIRWPSGLFTKLFTADPSEHDQNLAGNLFMIMKSAPRKP